MEKSVLIRPIQRRHEIEACARMMAASEPWLTLRFDYGAALRILSSPGKEIYLAFSGGDEILGFILLNLKGVFVGYIQSICVAPQWRGHGVGRKLVEFAEERVFGHHPNMFVCVSSFNHDARRFYHRLGYAVVGELKSYLVEGHSEILLRKSIGSLADFRSKSASA
jgi:ribosomal protein S18 acetylase RimI-like enzyme